MARIAIVGGAGYVGVAYASAFAELGHEVVGLDVDSEKVAMLASGRAPIHEPGVEQLLARGIEQGRLRFTTEYEEAVPEAEYVFITVGTPSNGSGGAEMRYVRLAAESIARHAQGHTVVVNKSTMPIGSGQFVSRILAENAAPELSFAVVSNPEFLREGSAVHDIFHPDRIVLGCEDRAVAERVAKLYEPLGAPVLYMDLRCAEMVKYAANAFLAAKISFINEVAQICEAVGADVEAVAQGVGMDERIGPRFLRAGAGFGGSCFPKDVRALATIAREYGVEARMLGAVLGVNERMHRMVVEKLSEGLGGVRGKTVAVLGLAFKPDTDDIRESPALKVIEELTTLGAVVRATDPVAMGQVSRVLPGLELVGNGYEAAMGADAVVVMTEWEEYRTLDVSRVANAMRGRVLVDGRNILEPGVVVGAGLSYSGIGRQGWEPHRFVEAGQPELGVDEAMVA